MSIVPLGRWAHLARGPRDGVPFLVVTIKPAVGVASFHPGETNSPCHVLPPGRVGECKTRAIISTRDEARGSSAQVAKLVMQGLTVGLLTYSATRGQRLTTGSSPLQLKATNVDAAMLKLPDRKEMARVADAIVGRHHQSTQARGRSWNEADHLPPDGRDGPPDWKFVAHESAPSVQALKKAVEDDLHALGLLAWSPHGKGLAARRDAPPRLLELASGNTSLLSAVIAEVVEGRVQEGLGSEAAVTSLIHVLNTRHRISVW